MDRFDYMKLRERRQDLRLPEWHRLPRTARHRAKRMTIDQLIARRVSLLLIDPDKVDVAQPSTREKTMIWNAEPVKAATQYQLKRRLQFKHRYHPAYGPHNTR